MRRDTRDTAGEIGETASAQSLVTIRVFDLLSPERVVVGPPEVTSRKRALEMLSNLLASTREPRSQRLVFDQLCARERLGSTGLGFGVALPHARVPELGEACGAFIRAKEGIEFDAPDGDRVDLIFGLVVPQECTGDHIEILAALARLFSAETLRQSLRRARTSEEVLAFLADGQCAPPPRP